MRNSWLDRRAVSLLGVTLCSGVALATSGGTTYAAYSDFHSSSSRVAAGVWAPDPPEACAEILAKPHTTITWGTPGDDVLRGGNHPQVLMGMGGNDTLYAGNQGDCLLGGDGDDQLYGTNARDVLVGGAGNDYLDGGNGKDDLDGGPDIDTCIGGNGQDTVVNCEPSGRSMLTAQLQSSPMSEDDPQPEPEPEPETLEEPAAEPTQDMPVATAEQTPAPDGPEPSTPEIPAP